ncbi:9911_t:CDS:2 [Ambispora leptoticha]|uniref:Ataxin-3 homolog n=1 Tax=Ambispora leptoticha TaxID=144679 RepID=A0A9N8WQU2_9GLOM|nr:9911_t:CDS:2 [Ambispora leptoticha]
MSDLTPYLFWEKQEGQLCAQHCLNSLLQGELFTAVDLGEIAQNLDHAEQAALQEGALPGQVPNASVKSQNMDDSGFFSVQVLSEALKVWNLEIIPIGSEQCKGVRDDPAFCLRKFGGTPTRWYNLDSLLRGPEWISQTYLGMLLNQLENDGYSIFVVRGSLPICQADEYAIEHPEPKPGRTQKTSDQTSQDDIDAAMIEAAIAASLQTNPSSSSSVSNNQQDTEKSNEISIDEIRAKRLTLKIMSSPSLISNNTPEIANESKITYPTNLSRRSRKKQEQPNLNNNSNIIWKPLLPKPPDPIPMTKICFINSSEQQQNAPSTTTPETLTTFTSHESLCKVEQDTTTKVDLMPMLIQAATQAAIRDKRQERKESRKRKREAAERLLAENKQLKLRIYELESQIMDMTNERIIIMKNNEHMKKELEKKNVE